MLVQWSNCAKCVSICAMAKKKTLPKNSPPAASTRSQYSRGAIPLARVKPDLAMFVWGATGAELRQIADSISKDLEMLYQHELLNRSGF